MTLLDAYALIAFVIGGPARTQVRGLLHEGAAVATANLAEVLDVCERVHGLPIARVGEVIDPLFESSLSAIPLDRVLARRAAQIRARHYHRSSRPISLADAILLASAGPEGTIATADLDVLTVAAAEGCKTISLPEQG